MVDKKVTKLIELILAACCYSIKYNSILAEITIPMYERQARMEAILVAMTYTGFLFLVSMFTMSTISGDVPKGIYMKFFNICAAVLYALSECVLYDRHYTVVLMLGLLMAILLAALLVLDCYDVIF